MSLLARVHCYRLLIACLPAPRLALDVSNVDAFMREAALRPTDRPTDFGVRFVTTIAAVKRRFAARVLARRALRPVASVVAVFSHAGLVEFAGTEV